MEKVSKEQVLDLLNVLMGDSLVWIHDSNCYDEGKFGSHYILRINENLLDSTILDIEELPLDLHDLLEENDCFLDEGTSVMHLSFNDAHDDYVFFDGCILYEI
jgi:hypothetical protein